MREVLEPGTVSGCRNRVACGRVDRLERHARPGRFQRGSLRLFDDVEDMFRLVARLAEDEGARDVGLVTIDRAAAVDHHDRSLANDLRFGRAMRQRRELPRLHAGVAAKADTAVRGTDQVRCLRLRHPWLKRAIDRFIDFQRCRGRELHELQLVRVLDHPASGGDRRSADDSRMAGSRGDAVRPNELRGFFDADRSAADSAVGKATREQRVGTLVLLPRVHAGVAAERTAPNLLARAILFERRTDEKRLAFYGNDAGEEALAAGPADVREVEERGPGRQHQRGDLLLRHQLPGFLDSRVAFVVRDRLHLTTHRWERGDRRWRGGLVVLCKRRHLRGGADDQRSADELSAIHEGILKRAVE